MLRRTMRLLDGHLREGVTRSRVVTISDIIALLFGYTMYFEYLAEAPFIVIVYVTLALWSAIYVQADWTKPDKASLWPKRDRGTRRQWPTTRSRTRDCLTCSPHSPRSLVVQGPIATLPLSALNEHTGACRAAAAAHRRVRCGQRRQRSAGAAAELALELLLHELSLLHDYKLEWRGRLDASAEIPHCAAESRVAVRELLCVGEWHSVAQLYDGV